MKEAGGKHMAALGIGAELYFVDGEEIDRPVERHQFDGADKIRRVRGQDLFFARNQRDRARAARFDDPVVVFAGEKPQREADHAALVIEHALDRKMRLAGVGRPEDRDKARCGAEQSHALKGAAPHAAEQGPR